MIPTELETLTQKLRAHQERGTSVGDALDAIRLETDLHLAQALAAELGLPLVHPDGFDAAAIVLLPASLAEEGPVCPMSLADGRLTVAFADPTDARLLDRVRAACGLPVDVVVAPRLEILRHVERAVRLRLFDLEQSAVAVAAPLSGLRFSPVETVQPAPDAEDEGVAVRLIQSVLERAKADGVREVHVETHRTEGRVRFRRDGRLVSQLIIARASMPAVIGRLKRLAGLSAQERQLPQTGEVSLRIAGTTVMAMVDTVPGSWGEKAVVMLRDPDQQPPRLDELGMPGGVREAFERALHKRGGIVLLVGPVNSGKTTLTCSALASFDADRLIASAEDSIEHHLAGVLQIPLRPDLGLTNAHAIRAAIRHHADVMALQVRDYETLEISCRAAASGMLVIARMLGRDSTQGLAKLLDIGLETYEVVSQVVLCQAQRIIRTLCLDSKVPLPAGSLAPEMLGLLAPVQAGRGELTLFSPGGCDRCHHGGYRGCTGVFESHALSHEFQRGFLRGDGAGPLRALAVQEGMQTLRQGALRLVAEGVTSLDEALAATPPDTY